MTCPDFLDLLLAAIGILGGTIVFLFRSLVVKSKELTRLQEKKYDEMIKMLKDSRNGKDK